MEIMIWPNHSWCWTGDQRRGGNGCPRVRWRARARAAIRAADRRRSRSSQAPHRARRRVLRLAAPTSTQLHWGAGPLLRQNIPLGVYYGAPFWRNCQAMIKGLSYSHRIPRKIDGKYSVRISGGTAVIIGWAIRLHSYNRRLQDTFSAN